MEATINTDTQTVALTKVDNGLEATPTIGLTPNESYVNQEKIDCNILLADAAAELNMSKSEVKTLVQKEKVQSELKDGHYYVNVDEVYNYLTKAKELEALDREVKNSIDKVIPTKALAPMGNYVVTKTEEEKAEFLKKYNLEINDIDGKLKRISSEKPVNSPFNYTGNKEELYPQILPYFKRNIAKFYDVFGGGGIVGLNVQAQSVVYNDIDKNLSDVVENLSKNTVAENYEVVLAVIEKYNLNIDNKEAYIQLRKAYNESKDKHWSMFYVLMVFSYQNNISYSKKHQNFKQFNKGFGDRDFNKSLRNKFLLFTDKLIANAHRMDFQSSSYEFINIENFQENDFVYLDPAYLLTAYKYGIEWEEKEEIAFLKSLDSLHERKVNFALSNIIHKNGKTNQILIDWAEQNSNYNVIYLKKSYKGKKRNKVKGAISVEVLITNYKTLNSQEVHEVTLMDTEIIQGRFVDNNTVENIKKHFTDAEEHAQAYVASMNNALREKCAELIGRIKTGQGLIVFFAECKRDGKVLKEEVQKEFPFSYETARGYVNLAKHPRIAALKIDDIMNFKRKSLDALKDIAALTDVEYELFRNGEFKLPKTRKVAKSRQKASEAKNDEVLEDNVSTTPDSAEMVPMAEDGSIEQKQAIEIQSSSNTFGPSAENVDTNQLIIIEELRVTIVTQNATIEKQKIEIEKYKSLMSAHTIERFHQHNNIFNRKIAS